MFRRLIVALALLCLPALAIAADVPYTGNLFESGTPVNGNRYVQFDVYDFPFGGPSLYTQAESLAVVNGVFHTVLTVPDVVWFNGPHWIGVSVNGGAELSPRVKYYAPPRPSPILVVRPSTSAIVTDQWTKVDSLTITMPAAGVLNINTTGYGLWAGPGAQSSAGLAISEATPTEPLTVLRAISANDAFSMTLMVPVTPGTRTYYVWGYNAVPGGTYSISSQRFQALYFPN